MKKIMVSAAVASVLLGLGCLAVTAISHVTGTAYGQAAPASKSGPHKIGLIDMAEVFKEYKKFEMLRNDLKVEIERSDAEAKQMADRINAQRAKLQQVQEGSAEYTRLEQEILSIASDLEAFRKGKQREFLRKESQIYKTVYLEVSAAVKAYSKFYNYTLILRFNRQSLEDAENPSEVIQRMNQLVVDFRPEDDITDSVLDYLNKKYDISVKGTPARN